MERLAGNRFVAFGCALDVFAAFGLTTDRFVGEPFVAFGCALGTFAAFGWTTDRFVGERFLAFGRAFAVFLTGGAGTLAGERFVVLGAMMSAPPRLGRFNAVSL